MITVVITLDQMLGCGAHVRIIALPHVRCACGKVFGTVRVALFWLCDVRSHFCTLIVLKTSIELEYHILF